MLDDLLEEVKAAAKNEALAEYENRIDTLEEQNRELLAELERTTRSNARWHEAYEASEQRMRDMIDALEAVIESYDGR